MQRPLGSCRDPTAAAEASSEKSSSYSGGLPFFPPPSPSISSQCTPPEFKAERADPLLKTLPGPQIPRHKAGSRLGLLSPPGLQPNGHEGRWEEGKACGGVRGHGKGRESPSSTLALALPHRGDI